MAADVIEANIETLRAGSKRGIPLDGPGEIVFNTRPLVRSSERLEGEAFFAARKARRTGAVQDTLRRDDHVATSTNIVSACEAFIIHPERRGRPLRVPGVPRWADTYRTVFKNLRRSDGFEGTTHIWWADVRTPRIPATDLPTVTFEMCGGSRIVVDRTGWERSEKAFTLRVLTAFAEFRESLDRNGAGEWVSLLVFAYGKLRPGGVIRVVNERMVHMLVERKPRFGSPSA